MAPKTPASFSCILQSVFLLTDDLWSYHVRRLPTTPAGWIMSLELVSNPETRKLQLKFNRMEPNRAIASQHPDALIHLSFVDFRLGYAGEGKWESYTARESADYLSRLLQRGISLNGKLYSFYGHSNSQLKSRSCYLLRGSKDEVEQLVESLGEFSRIRTVAKKAKRIGLLFSSCHALIEVPDERYEDIEDIESSGYNFTDGCGLASKKIGQLLSQKFSIIIRNQRYHPSVYQIRFKGYKGIVSIEPQMRKGCWFQFRNSMRKFSGTSDRSFAVVEYSKPYTYGYLNDDIVVLLNALGISSDVLLRKQKEHFQLLHDSVVDHSAAFTVLCSLGRLDLVEKLVLSGLDGIYSSLRSLVMGEYEKMLNKRQLQKCRILIPASRLIFGICDPRGVLEEGECFLRVTDDTNGGLPRTICNCEVMVTRNPCLHPGDLRKLKAVDRAELAHLTDCIVFPIQGKRPAADQMSGGDLDGDTFFVCWDPDLVPSTMSEPAEYPAGREPISFDRITVDDRINYLARYSSASLGRVKNLSLQWAARNGAMSRECQELNRLHSFCVDGNRINIPQRLTDLPLIEQTVQDSFILNLLHEESKKISNAELTMRASLTWLDSREVLETLLCQPRACSEFYMIQLVCDWCRKTGQGTLSEFLSYFDVSALSAEQRHWLLQELPPSTQLPAMIMNRLLSSAIIGQDELAPFYLDNLLMRWKCIFSTEDRWANLFEVIHKSFSVFHRKLLVLRIHERLSVAIYLNQQIPPEEEVLVGKGVRVLAFPHTQERANHRGRSKPTEIDYRLFYDHNTLQLYKAKRQSTFIFIGRPGNNDTAYKSIKGGANQARERQKQIISGENHDYIASINLGLFSRQVATQVGRVRRDGITAAELYVISNTDVKAFRTLDLWMNSIDTLETVALFEKYPPPLTVPQLATVDWASQPEEIQHFMQSHDLSLLGRAELQANVSSILRLCFENGESVLPGKIYQFYLMSFEAVAAWLMPDILLNSMIESLVYMAENVVFFVHLSPWDESFPEAHRRLLRSRAPHLLRATVQSTNTVGPLALDSIRTILREVDSLALESFRQIIEEACLTTRSPEQLLDIYLETLQPAGERLIGEHTLVTEYFIRHAFGVGLDHCEESAESAARRDDFWTFEPCRPSLVSPVLTSHRRLDAPQLERLSVGDHVRFELARFPQNVFWANLPSFDAIIESLQQGSITLRCLSYPSAFCILNSARWHLKHCGSFVTSKAMLDALCCLMRDKQAACVMYPLLVENRMFENDREEHLYEPRGDLNDCQNQAVSVSLQMPLTCIWGPPGTGKTQTVAALLQELLKWQPEDRVLVTAPTHNAVDNILKRYLQLTGDSNIKPLRVSTNIHKVDPDLMHYTCDGLERKELHLNPAAKRRALGCIQQARLVFTTCAGAGLGLLRDENFQVVIIDESSQQTEAMSLIPLTKGCTRAILVGDHVQLRATVRKHAQLLDFQVSLFERLYSADDVPNGVLGKVMLNVQYRMHPRISAFPSNEFYQGKLLADNSCRNNAVPAGHFPWPSTPSTSNTHHSLRRDTLARCVLVPCSGEEDVGFRSKGNADQTKLCKEVYSLLSRSTSEANTGDAAGRAPSIAILTPYARQVKLLQDALPGSARVSSIDGFQGQESDVIIFVTVRCNPHGDIGFLSDLRRLNVVLTRARAGLIVIGCPKTLTSNGAPSNAISDTTSLGEECQGVGINESNEPTGPRSPVDQDSGPVWKRLVDVLTTVNIRLPGH
ncbi:hypothetical protein MW887_005753 [Aspergillus wentii]|nr:hypothetical protein MW887_005753 [Aspergillus wentii]